MKMDIAPITYKNEELLILDQTRLPSEEVYLCIQSKEDVWEAIHELRVRGAPAIGVAAAYGLYVSTRNNAASTSGAFLEEVRKTAAYLASSRPTAVNLFWALDRMTRAAEDNAGETVDKIKRVMSAEAEAIRAEDEAACRRMGELGLSLLRPGMGILTHCNAGALAASKYGTCLAPLYVGQERGYDFKVFADETRPLLQGARLTAWELHRAGVDVTLICDNMASAVMQNGRIDAVLVGCDRMAANGDGANKIGTSGVAVLAGEYGIPFYMFVPTSSVDLCAKTGDDIPIELRKGEEIYRMWYKEEMAPSGIKTYNPAFDVTAAKYITAVVTEKGILRPPYEESLRDVLSN